MPDMSEKSLARYKHLIEQDVAYVSSWVSKEHKEETLARLLVMERDPPGSEKEWGVLFELLAEQQWVGVPACIMEKITQNRNMPWARCAVERLPMYLMVEIYAQAKTDFLARIMEEKTEDQTVGIIDKLIGSIGDVDHSDIVDLTQSMKRDITAEQIAIAMVRHPALLEKVSMDSRKTLTEQLDYVRPARRKNAMAIKRALLGIVAQQGGGKSAPRKQAGLSKM